MHPSESIVNILSIESSCDDTSAAVVQNGMPLSNIVFSQKIHEQYGGIVPEVASRDHQLKMVPVVERALAEASINFSQLHAIAFTRGPGLLGSLIVGTSFAKGLALSLDLPLIEVNHMQAHILAHFAEQPHPKFPFLCLTVSGGHTQIVNVTDHLDFELIGQTIDDAAGEAFDKSGKILGLGYPAGPKIDEIAQKGQPIFKFPEPQIAGFNFSFSGVKTAILYFIQKQLKEDPAFIHKNIENLCASIQHIIVKILINKFRKAIQQTGVKHIAIAGGVSANSSLRTALKKLGTEMNCSVHIPKFEYCTDNAAMIGVAGYYKFLKGEFASHNIEPLARYAL